MLSDRDCTTENIRIEIAGSVTNGMNVFGIYSKFYNLELPQWTGYLIWRQYVNELGGICVGGDMNMHNECTGKL